MKTDTPRPIHLKNYKPSAYLIDKVELDFSLHPSRTKVRSRLRIRPNPQAADKPGALVLDGEQLQLIDIKLDRQKLTGRQYKVSDDTLRIARPPAKPFTLEITTTCNPEANKALSGLYRSRDVYCTQCEAEGFRRITYFLDRPDILSVYSVRIEADMDEAATLLSNGNPRERGTLHGGKRHYAIWRDPHPKPSYLFALVGGNLTSIASEFKTMSGRRVDLRIHVEPGKEDRCGWAMDALKRAMKWDEKRFGREYDLDVFNIVAVSDFNMGAMENKGLNIFNDRLVLASPDTATDGIYEAIESVIAHEYFHNWTGNRITCRDWFQLCLKEGLTVFRDQEFSADERSATVQRIGDVRALKAQQFPEDAGPMAHPVRPDSYIEINNFYTATVYQKGAELCRMLQTMLGQDGFRAGTDLYFERHDGEAATVEDFIACFADSSGKDLSQFTLWYAQAGTPELVCSLNYNKERREAVLDVNQLLAPTPGQAKKKPMLIPLRLGLLGTDGKDLPLTLGNDNGDDKGKSKDKELQNGVIEITKPQQTFRFTNIDSLPVASLLRGFSAPVNLTMDLTNRELEFLMANDADLFNRWQAGQTYASRIIVQFVEAMQDGRRSTRGAGYIKALSAAIDSGDLEPAYRAALLTLPSESDIARDIARNVDPGIIHRGRRQLMRMVGRSIGPRLQSLYRKNTQKARYSPDAEQAGKRALRNAALTLLIARGSDQDKALLVRHYDKASNMTDQAHALNLLAASNMPARQKALDDFYNRWKDDHLVIDTWFSVQATSPLASTLAKVKALTKHPRYAATTPNKIRALVGSFAMGNPVQFNRPDGEGYAFVASQVLEIDGFNPQIAARMLGAFRSWRSLEPGRRKLARRALVKVSKARGLSRDVYEIVARMLEQS